MTDLMLAMLNRAEAFVDRGVRATKERVEVLIDVYMPDGRRAVVIRFGKSQRRR